MNRKTPVLKTQSAFSEQFDFLKKILFTFITIFLLGALNSCKTSIDDVVDNYNTNFTSTDSTSEKKSGISPGEPGFNEKNMLSPKYFLRCDGTLSLYASKMRLVSMENHKSRGSDDDRPDGNGRKNNHRKKHNL